MKSENRCYLERFERAKFPVSDYANQCLSISNYSGENRVWLSSSETKEMFFFAFVLFSVAVVLGEGRFSFRSNLNHLFSGCEAPTSAALFPPLLFFSYFKPRTHTYKRSHWHNYTHTPWHKHRQTLTQNWNSLKIIRLRRIGWASSLKTALLQLKREINSRPWLINFLVKQN